LIEINNVINYWNNRPCNIRHSDKPIGSKEYFDEVEIKKYTVEPHIPPFADFKAWKGKKVLEIGCGIGTDTINFARHGAIVTAVDISEESLKIAKIREKVLGISPGNIKFYQANAEKLSEVIPIEIYDLIYSFGVLHHTPSPESAISEIKKYMGEKTILKLMLYHKNSTKAFSHPFQYAGKYSEAEPGCPITHIYTKLDVKRLLQDFHIHEIKVDHIFPYHIKSYKKHIYKKRWYWAIMPKSIFYFLEKTFGWHLLITASLKQHKN